MSFLLAVSCLKPQSINNGVFSPEADSYAYGEALTFSCNRGLDLIGESTITCSNDGSFKPSPPQCLCEFHSINRFKKLSVKSQNKYPNSAFVSLSS